jgi:hypothetical protein
MRGQSIRNSCLASTIPCESCGLRQGAFSIDVQFEYGRSHYRSLVTCSKQRLWVVLASLQKRRDEEALV